MQSGYDLIFGFVPRTKIALDHERRSIRIDGRDIALSPREFAVLQVLIERPGRVVSRSALLRRVWGSARRETGRCLNVYLNSLRKKIEREPEHPRLLHTVRGRGLYFEA